MIDTSGFAKVNDTTLFYEMKRSGDPLVFIHSGGFDRRMWDDQFKFFSDYTMIRYDARGYGKSKAPTRPYSEQADLFRLLEYLDIQSANIVGLSLGGRIAIDFAIAHPEKVK
jgi:pimeloyl-ACP methyl ester carboxylesterase